MKSEQSIEERLRLPETLKRRSRIRQLILGAGAFAILGAGAVAGYLFLNNNSTKPAIEDKIEKGHPVKLTVEQRAISDHIKLSEGELITRRGDAYSRDGLLNFVIPEYENLRQLEDKVKDAPDVLKGNLQETIKLYGKVIDDAFSASDVYAYIGIDNWRKERKSAGGVNPLSVGKGKDLTTLVTEAQKIALLKNSRDEWKPYKASKVRGSHRFSKQDVYRTSAPIPTEQFKKVLEARGSFGNRNDANQDYLSMELWNDLTNGDLRDSEVCINGPDGEYTRLSAVYKGYSE